MWLPSTFVTAGGGFLAFPVGGNNSVALTNFVRFGGQTSASPSLNLPFEPAFSIGDLSLFGFTKDATRWKDDRGL